jgi:serine/threonine protein kinase, bacterial
MPESGVRMRAGGAPFTLAEPHDFAFLASLGEVFAVFDQNDSGNISFGLRRGDERYFLKYAGARTLRMACPPAQAVATLRAAATVYHDLAHPNLIELVDAGPIGAGFHLLFKWFAGDSLHAHWTFDDRPKNDHPPSPTVRLRQLPLDRQLALLDCIFSFHEYAAKQGYGKGARKPLLLSGG